ncbi:putative polysaccharide biosynthesis protein [Fonticella tunisiensis]|uniref:Stage V sporulation protein B n=1 Tax=Fonticella tunisiensis TaxID=1096341 RepID=A0A4R7KRV3_9CLOT|nr:polysaccharide biosynthesis protein [Fonticella tunisiensis]TDT61353.1 stage V sporulation protein B [Fonticella tunisiensis]
MKKQSTIGGFAYLSVAVLIVKVLSLLYLPVLVAILGDEGYGVYAASYQIFVVIYAVTNSGLPQSISKLVSELTAVGNYKDAVKVFKMSRALLICLGFIVSVLFFIFAKSIAAAVHYPRSYLGVLALAPTIFFSTINTSYRGYFQGRGNMAPTAVSQVIEQVINIVFTLILAYAFIRHSLEAAVGGGAFATSIAALFTSLFLVHLYRKNKESKIVRMHDPSVKRYSNKQLFKRILNCSIPLSAYTLMYNLGNIIDLSNTKARLLHAGFLESEATKLFGFLTKYNQLIGIPNAIITSLSVAILPAIAAAAARNDRDEVIDKIEMAFKTCFLISIPSAVGLSILSYPIYRLMKFGGGSYVMLYGAYVLVLMSAVQVFSTILQGLGRLYLVSSFLIIGIAGKIITNYFVVAIPDINILGAIIGNTIYYLIPLVLGNIILVKTINNKTNVFVYAVRPAIASGIMGIGIYGIYTVLHYVISFISSGYISYAVPALICIVLGEYVYFVSLIFMKGITSEDLNILPERLRKFIPKHMMDLIKKREKTGQYIDN